MTTTPTTERDFGEIEALYLNWRGEIRLRKIKPIPESLRFGVSEWHKEPQWLLSAVDLEKSQIREFALAGFMLGPRAAHAPKDEAGSIADLDEA